MLSRTHILLLFAGILLHSALYAQTVERTIKWDKSERTFTAKKGEKVKMLTFHNGINHEKDGFLPHYSENIRLSEYGTITATLSDEVYEAVTTSDIRSNKIESSIKVNAVPGMMRKVPYAMISLVPLRRNMMTGKIERLVKFKVKIEVAPDKQHKKLQSYSSASALASGTWYKVGITTTGIYKLDYNYLKNTCGFDLGNTNFSSIAVFGNGGGMVPDLNSLPRYDDIQENPTYIVDNNNNNRVDQGDYILFYAQGADQWTYDSINRIFDFTKNLYTDTNYYFVTADQGTGKRINAVASVSGANQTINQFDDYQAHEDDQHNFLSSGKLWFGDLMNSLSPTYTVNFNFPNIIASSPVKYSATSVASSSYPSTVSVSLNSGSQIFSQNISSTDLGADYPNIYASSSSNGTFIAPSGSFSFTYNFSNPDQTGSSVGYIYNIILNAKRSLTFTGGSMCFRSISSIGPSNVSQFNLAAATATTHIWDVSNITAIQEITGTNSSGTLSFTVPTPSLREFAAVDISSSLPNPIGINPVSSQNLHGVGQPNMLIITPDDLLDPSNDLAAFHSQNDHLTVKVATLSQIYNEFGSGKRDISAIRDFIRMVYDRATDSAQIPRYVLLMGDGSFDPKDRIADNNNQMPTYQSPESVNITESYTTDDFFGCLDPTEGGDMGNPYLMDVAVGRLPAASTSEAQGMVNKIKLYKSSATLASWRDIVTMVSDEPWDDKGGSSATGNEFEYDADGIAESVRLNNPRYNVSKIYCDAYQLVSTPGGGRYPDVNTAILNQINTGTLLISYTGHGGTSNWANARIFNLSDIQNLQNHEKLPTFVTATCEFSRFDDPSLKSAGEYLITNAQGGAAAMVTTVRPVDEYPNTQLQQAFFSYVFQTYQGRTPTIGEVLMEAKNYLSHYETGLTQNTRMFVLLGDPAMTLDYPQYNVVTTKVDNVPITQPHDTLKALKYITISGEVRDWTGAKMTSFSGTCFPLIYDKLGQYTTLANYPGYENFPYNAYKNTLFKGQCSVVNGAFSFSFIVPKDINYAIGNGRISYYADNGTIDAGGYQNDIVIGGSSDSVITSKAGPVIKLFMNDDKFVYGGITDANPKLFAELTDPYGINTTGNGLGHDMTCILDANTQNPVVLNNYYQSALNNFRQGTVTYPFTNLSTGTHTLKMKAWDILDNSSEDNTEFIVASSAKLALDHVFNYPNPFTTNTQFMFEHNRPGEQLNIMIQIFSVSGKLVKTIHSDLVSTGYRVDNIRWDGLDDFGDKIGKGVYVYKVSVQDQEGGSANKFQKLVVLR